MIKELEQLIKENENVFSQCWNSDIFVEDVFYGNYVNIDYTAFSQNVFEVKLISWICTDTLVGIIAYKLDNELIAISTQKCRKCNTNLFWASKEARLKMKQFLVSISNEEIESFNLIDNIDNDLLTEFKSAQIRNNLFWRY